MDKEINVVNYERKFNKLTIIRLSVLSVLVLIGICLINNYNKLGYVKPWLFIVIGILLILVFSLGFIFKTKLKKYINNQKTFQIYDITTFSLFIVLIFIFINTYLFSFTSVQGISMEPTLYENDRVVVTSLFYKPVTNDIVAFDAKDYDITTHDYLCKRILATSNDLIRYESKNAGKGDVYVNEELVLEGVPSYRYETMTTFIGDGANIYSILTVDNKIKEGYSILIGDNLSSSKDSRDFGACKNEDIVGKVWFRYFSQYGKFGIVR